MTTPNDELHHLEAQRRANREGIRAIGLNPYGRRTPDLTSTLDARALHSPEADATHVAESKNPGFTDARPRCTVAGRVMLHRDNGKLVWLNLRDHTGDLQVAVSQKDCSENGFKLAKLTDLSDILVATGRIMKTRTGEVTLWAQDLQPATKCLVPPPEKHAGLTDVELRYRQRYTDLWANPQTLRVFQLRSKLIARMRQFLDGRGFTEVETPMLQSLAGGAAARPFMTHMNALDIKLYMRIAPELYLKRLLVGGMPRVYEINRNFRNEGVDKQHNPEFTVVELYEAFGNYHTMLEITESMIRDLASFVVKQPEYAGLTPTTDAEAAGGPRATPSSGALMLPFGEYDIDFGAPFRRVRYAELFEQALGFPMSDTTRAREECRKRRLKHEGMDDVLVVNELFEEVAEKSLDPAKPTFVMDYPSAISPLTRPREDNPALAERWDLFIGGMEIGPAYTELNDPDIQESKFREQLKGLDTDKSAEENTFRTLDNDFLRALKVGMPPAGGMGVGIDRLVMLLTNQRTIRDVILFPLMRPEE